MAPRLNIVVVSTRPGRAGPTFAHWLEHFARGHGKFEPVLADLAEFNLPVFDEAKHPRLGQYENEHTRAWAASVDAADAFVFVTPEYNYFAPPSFVNAVSYLNAEWQYKPAGFLSYGGVGGGLRAVQSEKQLLTTMKVVPMLEGVSIFSYHQFLDPEGVFRPSEPIVESARVMLDELHKWAVALKPMRVKPEAESQAA